MPQAEDDAPFSTFAGTVLWPSTPELLTDTTRCPACLKPLTDIVCRNCGLDLGHPAASLLAAVSKEASDTLAQRVEVIGRIRYETSHRAALAETMPATPSSASAVPASTVPSMPNAAAAVSSPATAASVVAPTAVPTHAGSDAPHPAQAPSGAPRRSSVQVALLVVGVSLLSIFAIFFLVYAFINYGIVWRSVIIAAITVAAFVSATLLRRRALTASAEGLAVFALVLVYLDAYALRANDFFGLASADGAVYWGVTMTLASLGFIAWHRMSRVRSASIVGWASLSPGIGVLAWGVLEDAEPITRVFAAIVAAACAALVHALIPRGAFAGTLERMLVISTAVLATSIAFLVAWAVDPLTDWGGTIALGIVAAIALAHMLIAVIGRGPTVATRAFGVAFAVIGGVAAASAMSAAAVRFAVTDDVTFALLVPVAAAAAITLFLEGAVRSQSGTPLHRPTLSAAWASAGVLALTALLPLATAATPIGVGFASSIAHPWATGADFSLARAATDSGLAVLAFTAVITLAAAVWVATGAIRRRGVMLAWGTSAVLVLAVAQLPTVWASLAGWLTLSATALLLLLRSRGFGPMTAYRACLGTVLAASTVVLLVIGWGSLDTWVATTTATVVIVLACRLLVDTSDVKATLLGGATVLVLYGVAAASRHLTVGDPVPPTADVANASTLVGLTATLLLLAASFSYRRVITMLDRRTTFWITGITAGVSSVVTFTVVTATTSSEHAALLLPQFGTSLVSSILLFTALVLWVGQRANSALRPERIAASVALAPSVYWLVDSFARVLGLTDFVQSVVPITAALLAAAGALTLTLLRPSSAPRWAREAGVALVAVPAVLIAIADNAASGWLVLVIASVTVLLVAVSADGLFGSVSPRRHLGWLALALATAGLWWRLSSDRVEALEPYVLPLTAALLLIACLIHRAARRADARAASAVSPLVALAGLLVSILPLAGNAITGDATRPLIVFTVAAVLLIAGSILVTRGALQPYLDSAALAGGAGAVITATGRALTATSDELVADGWMVALLLVLAIAACGQIRARTNADARWRTLASQALIVIGIVGLTGIEANGFSDAVYGPVRAIATIALLSAIHIVAVAVDRAPLTRFVALVAVSFAAGAAVVGLATQALDFVELGSIPIAVALIVTGRMRLAAEPTARSWRTLGPGVAVLLLPSLIATASAPELWRLVALGVISVGVLIVGAVRRLQAPFILGLVVALIHGFATFAPQIRAVYESQEWWLWAGLAGVVLVLLAIRYEKRIQNLRDVVMRIGALR